MSGIKKFIIEQSDEELFYIGKSDRETIIGKMKDRHFKEVIGLNRLPSGKFAANTLVMSLGALVYDILRYIGLIGLIGNVSSVRRPVRDVG